MAVTSSAPARTESDAPGRNRAQLIGTGIALCGALAYGTTVVFGRMMAGKVPAATVLSVRFVGAGLLTLVLLTALRRPLLPAKGERLKIFGIGMLLYFPESWCFFAGLERGTAAAVALLFYFYPAVVTLLEVPLSGKKPDRRATFALALSFGGVAVVVASGASLAITLTGMLFCFAAVGFYSAFVITSHRLVRRTDPTTSGAWVCLGAGTGHLLVGLTTGTLVAPGPQLPYLLANAVVTVVAFACVFAALRRIGTSRTSIVMQFEAFAGVGLTWLVLGETLTPVQAIGGAAILAGVVLIARGREPDLVADGPAEAP